MVVESYGSSLSNFEGQNKAQIDKDISDVSLPVSVVGYKVQASTPGVIHQTQKEEKF